MLAEELASWFLPRIPAFLFTDEHLYRKLANVISSFLGPPAWDPLVLLDACFPPF